MLVFISDLHLMDGTAGAHHLSEGAFWGAFQDIARYARDAHAQEIKIVFLGDIFDLILTNEWFKFDPKQRPWGDEPSEEAARHILAGVIENNRKTFDLLSGELREFDFPVPPERVYVPGNHDRLCNRYASLRKIVCKELRVQVNPKTNRFDHFFLDLPHGTYARHGQEWDSFNFEGSKAFRQREYVEVPYPDYMQTPIGDVLAAEIASKLPGRVKSYLPDDFEDRDTVVERLNDLFDVRPLAGMIPWLAYNVRHYGDGARVPINRAVREVIAEFSEIPYVKTWMEKHDQILNPFDQADRLQLLFKLLETIDLTSLEPALNLSQKLIDLWTGDNYASRAAEEFQRLDSVPEWKGRFFYVLYGHTHTPDQIAIRVDRVDGQPPKMCERVYLNTGTWRPTNHQGVTKQGFIAWKNLTFSLIYQPGETVSGDRKLDYPAFETWTGAQKDF